MRILVTGSGAREYALLYAMSKDPQVTDLHVVPGNADMNEAATMHPLVVDDPVGAAALAKEIGTDLVVIGPEVLLVAGVADTLRGVGLTVSGPNTDAARVEGSKAFVKDVMEAAGVKTVSAETIQPEASDEDTEAIIDRSGPNWVVKDDGLVAGRGVVVTKDRAEALEHAKAALAAGNPVSLGSFLDGPGVLLFCLVDGEIVVPLLPAQDHKHVSNDDEGSNTGGMGAYSSLFWLPEGATERIVTEVCEPVIHEMVARGCLFQGLLYAGLVWSEDGPAAIEFNRRFGDPETQAVLALLGSPVAQLPNAAAIGALADFGPLSWCDGYVLTVVLTAEGYLVSTCTGNAIEGAEPGREADGILHAGTTRNAVGELVSAGDRVFNVTGVGDTLEEVCDKAYETIETAKLEDSRYRTDTALPVAEGRISI